MSTGTTGPDGSAGTGGLTDEKLTTADVTDNFKDFIKAADKKVEAFISANKQANGTLSLSASETLELQRLMADQSIATQVATTTLKSIKDSVITSARNI